MFKWFLVWLRLVDGTNNCLVSLKSVIDSTFCFVSELLSAVLKVFGLARGNLLGSLSGLAKQERMLVINDISGTRGVFHAVTQPSILLTIVIMQSLWKEILCNTESEESHINRVHKNTKWKNMGNYWHQRGTGSVFHAATKAEHHHNHNCLFSIFPSCFTNQASLD